MTKSIYELLDKNCIDEIANMPYCCNPLTVAGSKKKPRLVLDLRHVNEYLDFPKFKYEDLKTARQYFEKDAYFITFDLKSGYHHISINENYRKYLGFAWKFPDEKVRYFQFKVLPFGLASACYVFTKLMRPLVKKWRSQGIKRTMYLDDGIQTARSFEICFEQGVVMKNDMKSAGLTVNFQKSNFYPSQIGNWLGFDINTNTMKFFVTKQKIADLLSLLSDISKSDVASARQVSKIAGRIISMQLAIGPIARLFTRQMYFSVENSTTWDSTAAIDKNLNQEINFWLNNLKKHNGFEIKVNHAISKVVYSDASDTGYGGYAVQKLGNIIAKGNFLPCERNTSSTCRELLAVKFILSSLTTELANQTVQWFSDNTSTTRIIEVGSSKPHLQLIAIDIFDICIVYNIKLIPSWIPREWNEEADYYSKLNDTDNWGVDFETFEFIQSKFGEFTIDRFADENNKKVVHFNSKFYCPLTTGVNAFTFNWITHFNWLCPPVHLIGDVINHMRICKAKGILLTPLWTSSYFWPLITSNGKQFNNFVKDHLLLDPFYLNFSKGKSVFEGFVNFLTIAILIDFD